MYIQNLHIYIYIYMYIQNLIKHKARAPYVMKNDVRGYDLKVST